jgi:hypothetical protein
MRQLSKGNSIYIRYYENQYLLRTQETVGRYRPPGMNVDPAEGRRRADALATNPPQHPTYLHGLPLTAACRRNAALVQRRSNGRVATLCRPPVSWYALLDARRAWFKVSSERDPLRWRNGRAAATLSGTVRSADRVPKPPEARPPPRGDLSESRPARWNRREEMGTVCNAYSAIVAMVWHDFRPIDHSNDEACRSHMEAVTGQRSWHRLDGPLQRRQARPPTASRDATEHLKTSTWPALAGRRNASQKFP